VIGLKEQGDWITFAVRVAARASRTEVVGEHGGALRVRVAVPPVDGAANDEIVRFFAGLLGVPRGDVEIVAGRASKNKAVRVRGVPRGAIESLARDP
jgi:uncharacterized protein (TIGR00251 family)